MTHLHILTHTLVMASFCWHPVGWVRGGLVCHTPSRWLTLTDRNSATGGTWEKTEQWQYRSPKSRDVTIINTLSVWMYLPVDSVWSLEPSVLVTLHEINVFLPSFLSREDSSNTVLPSGMGLGTRQLFVRANWPWFIVVIQDEDVSLR